MQMLEIIKTKRDGAELTTQQIEWFIAAYTNGEVPDYQAAALAMAIYLQGMSRRETVDLTLAMAHSGEQLDLHDTVPFVVDKHSSGGVGDKTTLVVLPLVAACNVPVGKMSGRGLGSSGGTLDKMESFPGWSSELSLERIKRQLKDISLVLAGQTAELAPADGKLYALRDVTGTIASIPLIAASIMSKKLAAGADAVVLDVKVGKGAFIETLKDARKLARQMVEIGQDSGRETVALIADMNQPLGHAVGNALEVKEAIETMQGVGPADFWAHCLEIAGHLLVLAKAATSMEEAKQMATAARDNGRALEKFKQLVEHQGGSASLVDDPTKFAVAKYTEPIYAARAGYIAGIDAGAVGWSCLTLGGGRVVKTDSIDHAVGMVIPRKVGDYVEEQDLLGTVHANDTFRLAQAKHALENAISFSSQSVDKLPHFYETVM
jgi:pyrimidine-nucleoside phosphorylase